MLTHNPWVPSTPIQVRCNAVPFLSTRRMIVFLVFRMLHLCVYSMRGVSSIRCSDSGSSCTCCCQRLSSYIRLGYYTYSMFTRRSDDCTWIIMIYYIKYVWLQCLLGHNSDVEGELAEWPDEWGAAVAHVLPHRSDFQSSEWRISLESVWRLY